MSAIVCGVGQFILPGEEQSGDLHLVSCDENRVLIAAIDGIGHGSEAAAAAKAAASVLLVNPHEPVVSLVELCHERIRETRGVAMSIAEVDMAEHLMTWVGVGNVQGVLHRAGGADGPVRERLLLRPGVVGSRLPALQASVLTVCPQDTLVFVTDGIRTGFSETLTALESPQRAAERIIEQFKKGSDDALVLVVRLTMDHS